MKKLITTAFFAFFIFFGANAQNDLAINAKASKMAREMVNEVQLNESEYIRIRAYIAEKIQKETELKQMYSNDPAMLNNKLAEAENNYNHNLQAILSPRQFENYIAFNNRNNTAVQVAGNIEE